MKKHDTLDIRKGIQYDTRVIRICSSTSVSLLFSSFLCVSHHVWVMILAIQSSRS